MIITGLFYPHGKDWDRFVLSSIQRWEYFYIQWIRNGDDILFIYFEDLASRLTEIVLKKIIQFLNIQLDNDRLSCVLMHKEDIFKRETSFLHKNILNTRTQNFRLSNSCVGNELHTFNRYNKMRVVWINLAIRNVKRELTKRGLDPLHLSNYENTNIKINI